MSVSRRLLAWTLAAALAGPLAACGSDGGDPAAPEVSSTAFAPALGVDAARSTRTATGLYYRDLTVGTGALATAGQRVAVRFTGWLANGTQFGSNVTSGSALEFILGAGDLIPGLEQGVAGMRIGGRRQLVIPPALGYGAAGQGSIPGNAVLVVNVELVNPVSIETTTFAPTLGVDLAASTRTATGLYYRDLTVGTGATVAAGQLVSVRYTGWLANGTQFDSNVSSGSAFEFTLGTGQVIPGFDQGVSGMRVGGRRQIIIPPALGYGAAGSGTIPGNAVIVFTVEVVGVR
jgi:peptidylprolyl isomerase